jgi:hypothetical protein
VILLEETQSSDVSDSADLNFGPDSYAVQCSKNYIDENSMMGNDKPDSLGLGATMEKVGWDIFVSANFLLWQSSELSYYHDCAVFFNNYSGYSWVDVLKDNSEMPIIFTQFVDDTAFISQDYLICFLHGDNAGENVPQILVQWQNCKAETIDKGSHSALGLHA